MSSRLGYCPACDAATGRYNHTDYERCDNGHTIYRGSVATECTCSVPWSVSFGHAATCAVKRDSKALA